MAGIKVLFFYVIVVLTVISVSTRAVNISNTWMLPEEGFPVFYRYFRDRISWNEADAVCQFHHANLVTVDSTIQYDAIRAYLKELDIDNNVWIGLSRASDKHNFIWRDFRELSLTDYWQEAIPSGNDPLCVAVDPAADFRWHALSCGGPDVASFICELPVPSWAMGTHGCLLTELPSLTVLYIPEQSAVELTSDCGLGGTKRIACKGNTDRDEMMRRLACTDSSDLLEDKLQSPLPTVINQDANTNSPPHTTASKTTKPWIWTSNTVDTGDYSLPTRHRRETEMSPSTSKSTTAYYTTTKTPTTEITNRISLLTTETTIVTTPIEISSLEAETTTAATTETKTETNEEYPGAINQGQLFSIIENGTMFDIIELNGTEENKTQTTTSTTTPTPPTTVEAAVTMQDSSSSSKIQTSTTPATSLYTTVIYHKEPTEELTTHYKIVPTVVETKPITNESPANSIKDLTKEVEMFPISADPLMKLNRTDRKELPGIPKPDHNINIDVNNNIHENGKVGKQELMQQQNIDKPSTDKKVQKESLKSDKKFYAKDMIKEEKRIKNAKNKEHVAAANEKMTTSTTTTTTTTREAVTAATTTTTTTTTASPATTPSTTTKSHDEESLDSEPTTKPNRQRQLTRPQRRSFYPYFFSRVLG